ncbi:FAD/NAD(P)-binding domain-containing protein [Hymenopellis radicata]|nr:FAD/NAD(P)-binding domain-containing protein [Hymenopellis radicata]
MPLLPLQFIIVGASVAGLSSAYMLGKAGHKVLVVEMDDGDYSASPDQDGGLRLPPNMARLLIQEFSGILELFRSKGTKCSGQEWRDGETTKLLGAMKFLARAMVNMASDFYFLSHYDLCSFLRERCRDINVQFRFGFTAHHVEAGENGPAVLFSASGERLEGDIIVGADGHNSIVRDFILGAGDSDDGSNTPRPAVRQVCGASLSLRISDMLQHPEVAYLAETDYFIVWMGSNSSISGSRHGELYILGLTRSIPPLEEDKDRHWFQKGHVEPIKTTTPEYHSIVKKLLDLAHSSHPTIQYVHSFRSYSDEHAKVVVIGDAAHATPINGTYNAALAVEDAFTLGRLFSHLTCRSQIQPLLKGYNEMRFTRTNNVQNFELGGMDMISLPPGPQRDLRNVGFARTLDLLSDPDEHAEELAQLWADWFSLFHYDARDAVDEWWLNWGTHVQSLS